MTPALDTTDRKFLESALRGRVYLGDSQGYDDARSVWNAMIDRRPLVIVAAAGVSDIITAVKFARERSLPVAIRCGGHNVAGNAVGDGAMAIDLGGMKSVRVDPVSRVARADCGLLWREYDHETQAFGLASTGGAISTTGVAGLTLGGGYGYLARRHGMACDNLLSADLVTAAGDLITASADSHPDLYWALRGGGGNFGVVTSFEFQLHPVQTAVSGLIAFPFDMAKTVLQRFRDVSLEADDNFTLLAGLMPTPDGNKISGIVLSHLGSDDEAQRAIRPIRELGNILVDTVARIPYCTMQRQLDASYPKGMRNYWKSAFLKQLGDDTIDLAIEGIRTSPSTMNTVAIESYGGALSRIPKGSTAFDLRDAPFNLMILALSLDAAQDAAQVAWARALWQQILPYSTGQAYVNYLSAGDDVHTAYEDARYQRLAAVKAVYDSGNLFRFNQNIPPAPGGSPISKNPVGSS